MRRKKRISYSPPPTPNPVLRKSTRLAAIAAPEEVEEEEEDEPMDMSSLSPPPTPGGPSRSSSSPPPDEELMRRKYGATHGSEPCHPIEEEESESDDSEEDEEEEDDDEKGRRGKKGARSNSASAQQKDEERDEKDDDDEDEDESKKKKKKKKKAAARESLLAPVDEMVHNALLFLLLAQHKKIPAKKSDLVKSSMNGQNRAFEEVIKKLMSVFDQIFGMKLIGIAEVQKSGFYSHYIVISNYNLSVCDMVTTRDHDTDCRRSVLFLILTVIYMLNRSIDEDQIWKIINTTKLNTLVCEKRESLRKYLKQEFVSTMYLSFDENTDTDPPTVKYSWGWRAEKEFSKYSILKFVTKQFPGRRPYDFTIQYGMAKEFEGALVEADEALEVQQAEGEASDDDDLLFDEDDEDLMGYVRPRPGSGGSETKKSSAEDGGGVEGDNEEEEDEEEGVGGESDEERLETASLFVNPESENELENEERMEAGPS